MSMDSESSPGNAASLPSPVFALPVRGKWLIHSSGQMVSALMNEAALSVLSDALDGSPDSLPEPFKPILESLRSQSVYPEVRTGASIPPFLGLILSRRCNQGCRYCDFQKDVSVGIMSADMLVCILEQWARYMHKQGQEELNLHFFGGEPFVEEQLVYIAVHTTRLLANRYGMRTHFEATTNGLLSETMLGFVEDHFNSIVLSLDGQREQQDLHRPGPDGQSCFKQVFDTARRLSDSAVSLHLRCCVSQQTVSAVPSLACWFCEELSPETVDFEPLSMTDQANDAGLSSPDPLSFTRAFIEARREMRRYGVKGHNSALSDILRLSPCPVGQDVWIVNPQGQISSCYLPEQRWVDAGEDLTLGCVRQDKSLAIDQDAVQQLRKITQRPARCQKCFCQWTCAGGCFVRETYPGHSLEYSDFCRTTRLIQVALLLEELAGQAEADAFLDSSSAVSRFLQQSDDRWEGCSVER